jgi:hypothetical protein
MARALTLRKGTAPARARRSSEQRGRSRRRPNGAPATTLRAGGIALPIGATGTTLAGGGPVGGTTLALGADVSNALATLAPSFGDVLGAIGNGVATSQAALDQGVIDTVRALADTPITVVTDVIEQLNDDGLPDVNQTQLVTQNVSVLNFVSPTVHEWRRVALQMDLVVSALDSQTGIQVSTTSDSLNAGNFGVLFGILGVGYLVSDQQSRFVTTNAQLESQFAEGRVQLDAFLTPRRTGRFPVPVTVSIGPQIFVSQGAVTDQQTGGVVTSRTVDVQVTVRKANGAVNPNVTIVLDAAGLVPSFSTAGGLTGSTTNAQGRCLVTLTRQIPNPLFSRASARTCTVRLGDIRQTFDVTI